METTYPAWRGLKWGVRSVVGSRSEVMRAVNWQWWEQIVLMLARWQRGLPFTWRFALAFALWSFATLGSSAWATWRDKGRPAAALRGVGGGGGGGVSLVRGGGVGGWGGGGGGMARLHLGGRGG